MADVVVRPIAFYLLDKKVATVNKVRAEFRIGREPLFGQEGILAWSRGLATLNLTASGITPVGGSDFSNNIEKIIAGVDLSFAFVMGGKYFREKLAVTSYNVDSDSERGTTLEELSGSARAPKVTG